MAALTPDNGSRPVPDPTLLTTQQLIREIASLKELIISDVGGVRQVIETRLDGMDKAIRLLQETTDRFPAHIKESVGRLQELHEEKFASVATQFSERDTRSEQAATQGKTAIDAALAGQEKAISKQEGAFVKQIDDLGKLIATTVAGISGKIEDVKERITMIESLRVGSTQTTDSGFKILAGLGVVVSMLIGIGGIVVALALRG